MRILVINAGSSSLKFGVFNTAIEDRRWRNSVSLANTLFRVKEGHLMEMRIDTDEANPDGFNSTTKGELVTNEVRKEADIVAKKYMELNERKTA